MAIGAAGAAAFAWGSLVERTRWTLRRAEVPVLPAGAAPIRVLHLSDLHMAPWQRDKQAWVASLAGLKPDLIVDTGDNLGHERGIEGIRRAFEPFRGIPGRLRQRLERLLRPGAEEPVHVLRRPLWAAPPQQASSTPLLSTSSSASSAGRTLTTPPRASTSGARTSSSSASTTRTGATTASTSLRERSTSCAPMTRSATRCGPMRLPPPIAARPSRWASRMRHTSAC